MPANSDETIAELRAALERERNERLAVEARFRRLFRSLPIMAHQTDSDVQLTDVSDTWAEVLGYSREEVVGRRPGEVLTDESRRRALEVVIPKLISTGRVDDEDLQFVRRTGEVLDVLLSARAELDEEGRFKGAVAVLRDNTEQKRTSRAWRESEERYRRLMDTVPMGVFVRIGDTIAYVNQTAMDLMGAKSAEEIVGLPAIAVVHPDDQAIVKDRMERLNRGAKVPTIELRYVGRDGRIFSVEATGIPLTYDGAPASLIAFQDLTDRKKGEEAIRRAALQEEMLRVKEDTLRAISTPLLPVAERVVVVPLVGAVDAERVGAMLEVLLHGISSHKAAIAILDVTGTPEIEMDAAEALVRAAKAAGLLGAEVVLTGVSPRMAQALAEGNVATGGIIVKGTLKDGIAYALARQ